MAGISTVDTRRNLILGAIGKSRFRVLILTNHAKDEPESLAELVDLSSSQDPGEHRPNVVELVPTPDLRSRLRGVRLFLARYEGLKPATGYEISLGPTHDARHRICTLGDPDRLAIVVASCYYDNHSRSGDAYVATLRELQKFLRPSFKLLIGDNVYADVQERQRDRSLSDGYAENAHVYVDHFFDSPSAEIWRLMPTFTTWDDHELWNNFPEVQVHLSRTWAASYESYRASALECLRLFQASLNPLFEPAADSGQASTSYRIDDSPLVSIFVADLRSNRCPLGEGPMMLPEDLVAVETWARTLEKPGVLVIGQPLWLRANDWRDNGPPDYVKEFRRLWTALDDANWDVLIVTGDVHHSRIMRLSASAGRPIYEFVCSPANHIPGALAIAFGFYDHRSRGSVVGPGDVPVPGTNLKLRIDEYYTGTDEPRVIGSLQFTAAGHGNVDVGCCFWQCLGDGLHTPEPKSGSFGTNLTPSHDISRSAGTSPLFKMTKRPYKPPYKPSE